MDDLEAEIRRTTEYHTALGVNTTQTAKILKLRKPSFTFQSLNKVNSEHLYDEGSMDLDFLTSSFRYGNLDEHHRVNLFL